MKILVACPADSQSAFARSALRFLLSLGGFIKPLRAGLSTSFKDLHRSICYGTTQVVVEPIGEEAEMSELSDFNSVLSQVLALLEGTTRESALAEEGTAEWHEYEGRIAALNQVVSFFLELDSRKFGPTGKASAVRTLPTV